MPESFEVLPGIDPNTGNSYKPLEGKLYETGIKYAPSFLDGYINLALFDLEQTNSPGLYRLRPADPGW